ncbi:hypothetical protein HZC20_02785 [Candidatus Peregrinibacteria bacterium]|nr:hypothetical protein [Candidatus Peregrinibacteria bacterium]
MNLKVRIKFLLVFVFIAAAAGFYAFAFSLSAFAEGDTICSGKITGDTKLSNVNAGQIHFNSHPSSYSDANKVTNLAIVGLGQGLAPADRKLAACTSNNGGAAVPLGNDQYAVRGYAWDDNLGFVSFICDGGLNEGVNCGGFNYGVKIGALSAGKRPLSGYAWNESFGYIQMSGSGTNGGVPFNYGVTIDSNGNASGYAWSDAKVWIDFTGVNIQLPGKTPPKAVVSPCDNVAFVCVEVKPDIGVSLDTMSQVKVADWQQGYDVFIYLREADGVTPLDITKYKIGNFQFSWTDTVKRDQRAGQAVGNALDGIQVPIYNSPNGAVIYKPISIAFSSISGSVCSGSGCYNVAKIKSIAPTTDANVSLTTSIKPATLFKNETFFNKLNDFNISQIEPNRLILKSVSFDIKNLDDTPIKLNGVVVPNVVYPNNKAGVSLNFRPIVEVNPLYANNSQDVILATRNLPISFKVGTKTNGDVFVYMALNIGLNLDYDKGATVSSDDCVGLETTGFDIHYIDASGNTLGKNKHTITSVNSNENLYAVATLPNGTAEPCNVMSGPTIYSIVHYAYNSSNPKDVYYYSNHLPRFTSAVSNPAAIIHGSINSPKALSPTANISTNQTGTKNVNILADSIRRNITDKILKQLAGWSIDKGNNGSNSLVTIGKIINDTSTLTGDGGGLDYKNVKVGDDVIAVFRNRDVFINLEGGGATSLQKKVSVVVLNGNIYIYGDVWPNDKNVKLSLFAIRPYSAGCDKGNIYINSKVKNIRANMFADCSVLSYKDSGGIVSDRDNINSGTGLPKFASSSERYDALSKNQIVIVGGIAAHNTIGGSDLPGDILLDGFKALTKPVSADDWLRAQQTDLNYLRVFKPSLETDENGNPKDQICGKFLTLEDMIKISSGGEVFGDDGVTPCNGIDPLNLYNPPVSYGDLVPPTDKSNLAQGLDNTKDFQPVYIFYSAPDSILFGTF